MLELRILAWNSGTRGTLELDTNSELWNAFWNLELLELWNLVPSRNSGYQPGTPELLELWNLVSKSSIRFQPGTLELVELWNLGNFGT